CIPFLDLGWRVLGCRLRWNHAIVTTVATVMRIEIWSDVVCPWCYIGKRRFEKALEGFEHRDAVEVIWRSFELDPGAPASLGMPLDDMLAEKYGMSIAEAKTANTRV